MAEMQACAVACASWLQRGQHCDQPGQRPLASKAPAMTPEQVILGLPKGALQGDGDKRARQVLTTLLWLEQTVLPALDGRRAAKREFLARSAVTSGISDAAAIADLLYGDAEPRLAEAVRDVFDKQKRLEKQFRDVSERAEQKAKFAVQPDTKVLLVMFRAWLDLSEAILTYLSPALPMGLKVPRGVAEWNAARRTLEAQFKAVGFKNKEILALLPQGGSMKALKARTRRARRRAEGGHRS